MTNETDVKMAQHQPVFDLKWKLIWRISTIAAFCIFCGVSIVLYQLDDKLTRAQVSVAESVARYLELPLQFNEADVADRFRESYAVISRVMSPGQCLQYINKKGESEISNCLAYGIKGRESPLWFSALYRVLFSEHLVHKHPVIQRNSFSGDILVTTDLTAAASLAWSDISRMLSLSIALVMALCVMVYFVVLKSLSPAEDIIFGINKLAAGDLKFRLPGFHLSEFHRIGEVFNNLAGSLEKAVSERASLARRLLDAREQERLHLARVLHDEMAQNLSAINATALSIKITAATECPRLVPEAESMANTVGSIMKGLRQTVLDLRLQEIDGIGLKSSLEGLTANYQASNADIPHLILEVDEETNNLSPELSVNIFHIIQEGITNAIKHAQANQIFIRVTILNSMVSTGGSRTIKVVIEDDGRGMQHEPMDTSGFGLGLIGIRERALAFGGQMNVQTGLDRGVVLSVTIPLGMRRK